MSDLTIKYKLYEHVPVFNMEEMSKEVKLEQSPMIKTLLFSDSKKADTHYMVVALMETKPEKGNFFHIQLIGKKLEPPITMSE